MIKHLTPRSKEEIVRYTSSLTANEKLILACEQVDVELCKEALNEGAYYLDNDKLISYLRYSRGLAAYYKDSDYQIKFSKIINLLENFIKKDYKHEKEKKNSKNCFI